MSGLKRSSEQAGLDKDNQEDVVTPNKRNFNVNMELIDEDGKLKVWYI